MPREKRVAPWVPMTMQLLALESGAPDGASTGGFFARGQTRQAERFTIAFRLSSPERKKVVHPETPESRRRDDHGRRVQNRQSVTPPPQPPLEMDQFAISPGRRSGCRFYYDCRTAAPTPAPIMLTIIPTKRACPRQLIPKCRLRLRHPFNINSQT